MSRSKVADMAMDFVIKYEKMQGRKPKNVSKNRKGYDIYSSGRRIEVKGTSSQNPGFVGFNQYNFKALQKEKNFWLYIVVGLADTPKLLRLNKLEVLSRARMCVQWEIPVRTGDLKKA